MQEVVRQCEQPYELDPHMQSARGINFRVSWLGNMHNVDKLLIRRCQDGLLYVR